MKGARVPAKAKPIVEAMAGVGFVCQGHTGKDHLVFTREGVKGQVVTSATPRSAEYAALRAKGDARRLMRSQGIEP